MSSLFASVFKEALPHGFIPIAQSVVLVKLWVKIDVGVYARYVRQGKPHRPRAMHLHVDNRGLIKGELALPVPDLAARRRLADGLEELGHEAELQLERPAFPRPEQRQAQEVPRAARNPGRLPRHLFSLSS
ncbi:hypothetical protein EUGRSUZ_E02369 [Eucalyptus grandis]|uniref:Uncharacterized protein n=2 Tax=Eucalyptus grandis TaxID=71139 RepID=A0ACC3KWP1_EUCGR|nr:hypothetical protein EUGRSUZ_E02369 [Eucalyptus grandis]